MDGLRLARGVAVLAGAVGGVFAVLSGVFVWRTDRLLAAHGDAADWTLVFKYSGWALDFIFLALGSLAISACFWLWARYRKAEAASTDV